MTSPCNSSGTPVSSRSTTGTADAIAFPPPLRSTDQAAIATHAVLRADALLYLLFGILGPAMAFASLAWLTGNLTNTFVGSGTWAPFRVTEALLHPEVLWPALSTSMLMVGARVVPALFTVALVVTATVLWTRWRAGAKSGLARKADLAPLLNKEIGAKAKSLRPSLGGRESKRGPAR